MLSESHSSFHIELHQTFFDKTDGQLFCRGNNGCWRWGGPSARYNPPLPWALRQVWEHRAKLNSLCTQILTFCEKKQINKKRVLKTIFSNPGLSTQWSRVQCSGSGRTSSKLPGVERLADSLAFRSIKWPCVDFLFYQMTLCWWFFSSNLCGITASSRELHPSRIVMFLTWPAGKKHHSNPNHKHHVLPWPDQVWSQPAIPTRLDGWSWDAGPLEVGFALSTMQNPF